MKAEKRVPLGIALIVLNENRLLLGRRTKQPMPGSWQLPGGWLHPRETPEQTIARKIAQFPLMRCDAPRFVTYTNNRFEPGLHSVSLYFRMNCLNVEGLDLSLNKHCSDWLWADWYDLPDALFLPLAHLKDSGYQPFARESEPFDGAS